MNLFNNHFKSIGEQTLNIALLHGHPVMQPSENNMFLSPVEYCVVNQISKNLKNKLIHDLHELPPKLIKKCADELTLPLTILINNPLKKAWFHKKDTIDEKHNPCNYRPIVLLPTMLKILEKAMTDRVYSFSEKYNIFDEAKMVS